MIKRTFKNVWSPERRNRRDVDIYLPASYSAGGERYPVVYMHDGQNLSDPATAFAGTWELEPALERLADRGIEAIVVGVHNTGVERLTEYSPFPDRRHGGGDADQYLAFLAQSLKPRVDRRSGPLRAVRGRRARRSRENPFLTSSRPVRRASFSVPAPSCVPTSR